MTGASTARRTTPSRKAGAGRTSSPSTPRAGRRHAMDLPIQSGDAVNARASVKPLPRREFGYTLIELMIVMAIISIMMAIAIPIYQRSLTRTKEALLKNNLFTLRTVIDEYTFDKKKAPQNLQDLVNEGYLRAVPIDPITGNDQSWRL